MTRLTDEQNRRNQLTANAWTDYAPHREIVTELLLRERGEPVGRLCVLGAGNANDLDLAGLTGAIREIHLFDLDPTALAAGIERQGFAASPAVACHAPADVTGVVERLERWTPQQQPADAEVADAIRAVREFAGPPAPAPFDVAPFDVVASTCLLTQLIEMVAHSLAASHPRFMELLLAVRNRHLRLLLEWTAPGGTALLVTDFLSSDTCPELARVPAPQLGPFVAEQIARRNFFTGANPQALGAFYERDEQLRPTIAQLALTGPWRWQVGPRTFAVCALEIRRQA